MLAHFPVLGLVPGALFWLGMGMNHIWAPPGVGKVSLLIPITYLIFWAVLLCFSLYSEPVVCGLGMVIMLTGVPVYFVGVHWKDKPKWVYRVVEKVTYIGQKVCYVVFPQEDPSETEPLTASKAID